MKPIAPFFSGSLLCVFSAMSGLTARGASHKVTSPDGHTVATVILDESAGTLSYQVTGRNVPIIDKSPLGIATDLADFTAGLVASGSEHSQIDETYTLPQGKVSTYHNRANQLTLKFKKEGHGLSVVFRAYDEGIAFRYAIGGVGEIRITGETTGFRMAGEPVYWGQKHPNSYGYEDDLGRIEGPDFSLALLCEFKNPERWVLLSQAATYGSYCLPHLHNDSGMLRIRFPRDQKEPVKTTLPFESPWRVAVVSHGNLSNIVEQTLFENLNPPTEPELRKAAWIRPGRATWDWFAGDKKNTRGWVDCAAEMGWQYHLLDDGWEGYVGDIPALVKHADAKNVGVMVWKATGKVRTPEAMHAAFKEYAGHGFKGAKIDFFDRLGNGPDDYEDTQMAMQVRDDLCRIAAEYRLQLVFHGASLPTGERRRWPHLLSTEAVKGQEGSPAAPHDNCIAYIRNPLGAVDYSPVWFDKGGKSDAYQLGTSVVFESGLLLFADLHNDYLNHPSKAFLQHIPAAWDETRFIDGYPASHTVIARRKGKDWYIGGITAKARSVAVPLGFLDTNHRYQATIIRDAETGRKAVTESRDVGRSQTLEFALQDQGGFVVRLTPSGAVK